jgi:hypothetical protein
MIEIAKGYMTHIEPLNKLDIEKKWQESELLRTDNWPADRPPGGQSMLDYRVALRNYNNQPDFPNGERPTL